MNVTATRSWTLAGLVSLGVIGVALLVGGCGKCEQADTTKSDDAAAAGGVVNTVCPMMGTTIDPAKVPENLTRKWKGQTVGFCCGGCPADWDKLSDEAKDMKLKEAAAKAAAASGT